MEISRIISDLETLINPTIQTPIAESTLIDLQTLLNEALTNPDDDSVTSLFEELSSKNLSISHLVNPITAAMDSGQTTAISVLASNVYLSLLLAPNAPVFTLFTPMSFMSLLSSIRRALKKPSVVQTGLTDESNSNREANKKRKGVAKGKGLRHASRSSYGDEREEGVFDLRELVVVLERFELVLDLIHLNRFPDSLKSLIQTVVEIPVMALELCGNTVIYGKLTELCSSILIEVLRAEHGDPACTAAEVLKSLSALILHHKSQARTFALGFVKGRMIDVSKKFDGVKKAIVNFPRYLSQKAPEKAEPRALAVEALTEIVKKMELDDQIGFVEYVVKMTRGKAQLRLLAVDIILMLLTSLEDPLGVNSAGEADKSWGLNCLEALIHRCSDLSASIRARAMSNLAQLVGFLTSDSRNRDLLKKMMGFGNGESKKADGGMNDLLRKRCMDDKAAVRKAALLLISKLTALLSGAFDGVVLKTLGMACADPLVSIRKAAVLALSEAFREFSDDNVTTEWLHSVPRLISDNESSIQEECENLFLELVLDRISRASSLSNNVSPVPSDDRGKTLESSIASTFPEGVLSLLKETCNGEVAPWVKKICSSLGKKKRLKPKVAVALQNIIRTSESVWVTRSLPIEKWTAPPGAWFLLSEVSSFLPKAVDWEFLHHHWQLLDKYSSSLHRDVQENEEGTETTSVSWAGDRVFLLQTISSVSVELPPEPAADLAHNLLKRVEEFNMHSTEVNAHIKALRTLCKRKALNPEEADTLVMRWVHQILSKACEIVEIHLSKDAEVDRNNILLTPPPISVRKKRKGALSMSKAITAVYTIGSLVIVCPSVDLKSVIPVLHTIITSENKDAKLSKLPGPAVSVKHTEPSLYIQAWVTMGKICLADGKLAKSYIPLFVQELENSDSAALRNNLVVMMSDFCVCHTALVDCYISKITKCLRDPCELVRRQTFILLSRLLQRDYVKWRGVLFLRFLLSLVDESVKIRQLADFLFGNILKAKAPLLAYNSFVEAIFVLNDCHSHSGLSDSKNSRAENKLFSIRGNDEKTRSMRMHIYVSLLKQMAPEHLLATFAKLCAEILASVSDGMLNVDDNSGQSVLQDTFMILSCKEIRITPSRGSTTDPTDIEEETGGSSSTPRGGAAITQAIKKSLIQNTIPIFIELKRLLESKNSPLIGSLMDCLRALLKDYKNEIDDMLIADKQLQKELIYDMKKYEALKTTKVASEVANAEKAKVVLREVNQGLASPPLSCMSLPKVKNTMAGTSKIGDRPVEVIESLRRRQFFSDDEN